MTSHATGARRAAPLAGVITAGLVSLVAPEAVHAQVPLGSVSRAGQTVTPAYEGWYINADGTRSISFGYYNRNFDEVVEIPLGPNNIIEPAEFDGLQPTRFDVRRHWGVFTVTVPAEFDPRQDVVWTLRMRNKTFAIPGRLHTDWQIDALAGEAETGNTPPVLAFTEDGPRGQGPGGIMMSEKLNGHIGDPVAVTVWSWDDGNSRGSVSRPGREAVPVTLTWFKHQGPGDVVFEPPSDEVPVTGGASTVMATFSEPGEYTLRVRANDASGVAGAGHSQCCWTNGFVRVSIAW